MESVTRNSGPQVAVSQEINKGTQIGEEEVKWPLFIAGVIEGMSKHLWPSLTCQVGPGWNLYCCAEKWWKQIYWSGSWSQRGSLSPSCINPAGGLWSAIRLRSFPLVPSLLNFLITNGCWRFCQMLSLPLLR